MKSKMFLMVCVFINLLSGHGQTKKPAPHPTATDTAIVIVHQKKNKSHSKQYGSRMLAWDLGSFYTPITNRNFFGFNTDLKYYWARRFSTGISWSFASKKINESYAYVISQPVIYYNELGVINEFEFLQTKWVRMNVNLNNGLSSPYLGDNAHIVNYGNYSVPTRVTANNYYMLEPGLSVSFEFSKDFYMTLKGKYRFVYGRTYFGTIDQFTSYYIGLTLSIISTID